MRFMRMRHGVICGPKLIIFLFLVILDVLCDDHVKSPDDPSSGCVLDFTSYPYKPTGECIGNQETINDWDSLKTTLCCRAALTALSLALARRAHNNSGGPDASLFLTEDEWRKCSGPFSRQHSISAASCGFQDLYSGGANKCSALTYSDIRSQKSFSNISSVCSNMISSSFDDDCTNCTNAMMDYRNSLLDQKGVQNNDTEKAMCSVAIVVSIAADHFDNRTVVDDFYSCLPALDKFAPGYLKLKYSTAKLLCAILIAIFVMLLVVLLIKIVTKGKAKPLKRPVESKAMVTWSGLYRFSKSEIENAINSSKEAKSLGRGSAGVVYKGILPSGQVVAIKHIFKSNTSDSFTREVEGLSRIRHPNLVCLFGCCIEGGEQYLVYEYCPNGNLAQHLLRKDTVLPWERRVKILRDCALALRYLHHYIDGCIVHRDIKLTNILLTEDLDPKLSDFGLAKMLGMEESKVFTDVRGTIGYMDPEYMSNAKLTCASDIYSFGIVVLQILSGQKVIELDLDARDQLTRKAKDVNMGKRPLTDFEDPRLNGNLNRTDFESILEIAVLCVAKSSKGRPTIDIVFEETEKAWKNTKANMKGMMMRDFSSAAASPLSRSLEVIPV